MNLDYAIRPIDQLRAARAIAGQVSADPAAIAAVITEAENDAGGTFGLLAALLDLGADLTMILTGSKEHALESLQQSILANLERHESTE